MTIPYEDRKKAMELFAEQAAKTNKPLDEIALDCGHYISSLHRWSLENEDLGKMMQDACIDRAHRYLTEAQKILDELDCFWTDNKGDIRERHSAVNKAKAQVELRYKWAGWLAPTLFGDNASEIRQLLKEMLIIKKALEDKK